MIEAIPVSTECLILVITKVEDPDELDTRFSKFSSFNVHENTDKSDSDEDAYADEIINSFDQMEDDLEEDTIENSKEDSADAPEEAHDEAGAKPGVHIQSNLTKTYSFRSLQEVTQLAYILVGTYNGINTLYKNPVTTTYYLVISITDHTPEEFNKVCNIISEYGKVERSMYASSTYYKEHFEVIVKDHALQILSVM
jgi:adapter protein MecA 1/2